MPQYLISFAEGAMVFPEEDLPDVAAAARAVIRQAKEAGVFVFTGGLTEHDEASVVDTDGTVTEGPHPKNDQYLGGFAIMDVPTRAQALEWAAKIAVACRCAQEVREIMPDPEVYRGPVA
ncbi:hypothetical protein KDL01_35675 [Actinospica durhamensis]|uniref:YCII-related domain-containing protein n=1 Tax=Actinospica durhamensis TaxID=1508375 RepID=A0A941IV69_9ACTN|nr:YciI family protein [Actinospica durhamensis]MBR7838663.1 hypothetical protein [Actinospica durhamensis]